MAKTEDSKPIGRAGAMSDSAPGMLVAMSALVVVCMAVIATHRSLLVDLLRSNQLVQAFVASTVFGVLSYSLVTIGNICVSYVRAATLCSVTITNKDECFDKIVDYIGQQGITMSGALMAQTKKHKETFKSWREEFFMGTRRAPEIEYRPANNNDVHVFTYKGRRMIMARSKGETVIAGWERQPLEMETLTLSTWGGDSSAIRGLIDDAINQAFQEISEDLNVYVLSSNWFGTWERAMTKKPRPISSVILDEDLADGLLSDARDFRASAEWYESVGIPYRRGYLLYGPPGCGKTSFVQALAGALKLDLCMLTLSNKSLDDTSLAENLREAPANSIVLLEDVDAVFVERSTSTESHNAGVTFSGLLNAIDGVASQEGRLFFMTTNHIDKLDPALIRPGRCDVKVELRRASRSQAAQLFERFFPGEHERASVFAAQLPQNELSMAQLQGYLLEHKGDPSRALKHVPRLLRVNKPADVDRMTTYEHLRRVGLERWACEFEYQGYEMAAGLKGLGLDVVKGWSLELRLDDASARRLELLLSEDKALMEDYQLADLATVKDMFMGTFGVSADGADGADASARSRAASLVVSVPPSPRATPQASSEGMKRGAIDSAEASYISQLADELCARVQRDGKGAASRWQLRRHLSRFGDDAQLCVGTAHMLVAPRALGAETLLDDAPTFALLRRACLEEHAHALEDGGFGCVRELTGRLTETVLKDELGIKGAAQASLLAIVGTDGGLPHVRRRCTLADRRRVREAFMRAFTPPGRAVEAQTSDLATKLAATLSDEAGEGLVSIAQLEAHLSRHKATGGEACVSAARAELLDAPRPERPPAAEPEAPTEWVHGWLTQAGLGELSSKFIDAKLCERTDLLAEPALQLSDLKEIGIDKPGDQRRMLALLKELRAGSKGGLSSIANGTAISPIKMPQWN